MELQNYIRSKCPPDELMFILFDITRRDNVVEELIDYIVENYSELYGAEDKISELECNLEQREKDIKNLELKIEQKQDTIDSYEANEVSSHVAFSEFTRCFKEKNDRYPSIDETWECAWNNSK